MKCLCAETLTQYIDNGFPKEKALEIKDHLSQCPGCREREKRIREEILFAAKKIKILDPPKIPPLEFIPPHKTGRKFGISSYLDYLKPISAARLIGVSAAVILMLVSVTLTVLVFSPPGPKSSGPVSSLHNETIIRSVDIGGQPVETFIIREKETNTTLIWVEKKTIEEKGGNK
jgi:anti-sigma factor RsiW